MSAVFTANLVGREEVIAQVEEIFAHADEGRGQTVLLASETGCGKSTLARKLCSESGFQVFSGRAIAGRPLAYHAITAMVRGAFRDRPELATRIPASAGIHWLLEGSTDSAPRPEDGTVLAEQIAHALLLLADDDPTIFLLEDLHDADFATLALLPHWAELAQGRPVVLLLTARTINPADPTHPLRATCAELRRLNNFHEITLPNLSREQTGELATQYLGAPLEPTTLDRLFGLSGGTPFFVQELCRALENQGMLEKIGDRFALKTQLALPLPPSIMDAILLQLKGLRNEARAVLEIAALIGEPFELEWFCPLFEDPTALDDLFAAGLLIEERDGRARFPHILTGEAVAGAVPWSRRRQLHRQIAGVLDRAHAEAGPHRAALAGLR